MLKLLQFLFTGHIHKYNIIKEESIESYYKDRKLSTATRYYLQCEICGEIKIKEP